jgi:hypothetical protein
VKHGDEMHSLHEYDPGTAARWALQNNIGRCTVEVGGATAGEAKPTGAGQCSGCGRVSVINPCSDCSQ